MARDEQPPIPLNATRAENIARVRRETGMSEELAIQFLEGAKRVAREWADEIDRRIGEQVYAELYGKR